MFHEYFLCILFKMFNNPVFFKHGEIRHYIAFYKLTFKKIGLVCQENLIYI